MGHRRSRDAGRSEVRRSHVGTLLSCSVVQRPTRQQERAVVAVELRGAERAALWPCTRAKKGKGLAMTVLW